MQLFILIQIKFKIFHILDFSQVINYQGQFQQNLGT